MSIPHHRRSPTQETQPAADVLGFPSSDIATFLRYQQLALEQSIAAIQQQENIKAEYELLASRLTSIADKTRVANFPVPLGPHCLVRGELIHTNEILVFLGDGYFVERTSKQALDIVARRLTAIDGRLKKLVEQRDLLRSRMDMLANLTHQQNAEDIVEIREKLDEAHGPGEERSHRENFSTDEDIKRRLDELEEQEKLEDDAQEISDSQDDSEELHDDFFKRPIPPPTARPRRSSLPSDAEGKPSRKKSVTFAPFEGGRVPERENKTHDTVFQQALRLRLVGTRCKSMDPGEDSSDEWYTAPSRTVSEGGPPKLKKQEHISSMDIDLDGPEFPVLPVADTDVIMERNVDIESPTSSSSPANGPLGSSVPLDDHESQRPVSRFKASRMQR